MHWHYSYQERLALEAREVSEAINAGTYGHKLLEIYYAARLQRATLNDALAAAFSFNIDEYFCKCGRLKNEHPTAVCPTFDPAVFNLNQETRLAVQERLRIYTYTYVNNDFVPNNENSLEVGFSVPILDTPEELYVLEGRIDMIARLQGLPCIVDHKFQMRSHSLYPKSIQFRNYDLVTQLNMLVINYIRLTKGFSKDTLARHIVTFTPFERQMWKNKLIQIYRRLRQQIESGLFEQNFSSCGGRYGYNCIYTPLCEEPNQDLIELKKSQAYVRKEEWRPW